MSKRTDPRRSLPSFKEGLDGIVAYPSFLGNYLLPLASLGDSHRGKEWGQECEGVLDAFVQVELSTSHNQHSTPVIATEPLLTHRGISHPIAVVVGGYGSGDEQWGNVQARARHGSRRPTSSAARDTFIALRRRFKAPWPRSHHQRKHFHGSRNKTHSWGALQHVAKD